MQLWLCQLIMARCRNVHVRLLKWVNFHTCTTRFKMPSAVFFYWMNSCSPAFCSVTDVKINNLEDTSASQLRFWPLLCYISLPVIAFPWAYPLFSQFSSSQVDLTIRDGSPVTPLKLKSTEFQTATLSEGDRAWKQRAPQLSKPLPQNQINDCCVTGKTKKTESTVDFHLITGIFQ